MLCSQSVAKLIKVGVVPSMDSPAVAENKRLKLDKVIYATTLDWSMFQYILQPR